MKRQLILTAAALAAGFLGQQAHAAILYSQYFDSPTPASGDGSPLSNYGWTAHRSDDGERLGGGTWANLSTSNYQNRVVQDGAAPTPSGRVFQFHNGAINYVNWTTNSGAINYNTASYTNLSITWADRNSATAASGAGTRAVVRIFDGVNSTWYASTLVSSPDGTTWTNQTALLSASIWQAFTFTGTESTDAAAGFSVANGTTALPTGTITAVGLYSQFTANASLRFDSFALNGDLSITPPTISLTNTIPGGYTNVADDTNANDNVGGGSPGHVSIVTPSGTPTEIDGLTSNVSKGSAQIGTTGSVFTVNDAYYAMLWIENGVSNTALINALVTDLETTGDTGSIYDIRSASTGDLDADMLARWTQYQALYGAFDILVRFNSFAPDADGSFLNWDFGTGNSYSGLKVDQVAVIPEPASLALLGLGAVGLLASRRRK